MRKDEKGLPRIKKLRAPGLIVLLLAGALGILLLLLGSFGGSDGDDLAAEETDLGAENAAEVLDAYTEALEAKIASLCERVDGVSSVRVAVTLESGYEYVYAKDAEAQSGGGEIAGFYQYVTIGSGSSEKVVYLSEKPPKIGGIGIVCRGGGDAGVKRELIELVSAAFGVASNNIYVTEGG